MNIRYAACVLSLTIMLSEYAFAEELAETQVIEKQEPSKAEPIPLAVKIPVLTLEAAIEKAIERSPRLKSADSARLATIGQREQAAALPNPSFSVEAENFAGGGDYKGLDSAEITYGVSQLVEISGKRSARIDAAEKGKTIAETELQASRLDLIRDVKTAFAEAVGAAERVKLAEEQKRLAGEVLQAVIKRVDAAADPLYQKNKAQVANAASKIALDRAQREARTARQKLSVLWGGDENEFALDAAGFFAVSEPASLGSLKILVKNNPDFAIWDLRRERKSAELNLERAAWIPDPSISLGVRDLREKGNQALVAGVSLPFPVFDQNSGNISRAQAEASKTETDGIDARNQLLADLSRSWEEAQNSYQMVLSLRQEVIPSAEESFKLARFGYGVGKFPYLEVLDAQRTLFESRQQYYEALKNYHVSSAEVERITAVNFNKVKVENEEE